MKQDLKDLRNYQNNLKNKIKRIEKNIKYREKLKIKNGFKIDKCDFLSFNRSKEILQNKLNASESVCFFCGKKLKSQYGLACKKHKKLIDRITMTLRINSSKPCYNDPCYNNSKRN